MDIFSQSRCRNNLITKSKMALLGNHFSDFVSTAPGRIPSVLKVAHCNHSRYYQFAILGVLPGKRLIISWWHSVLHGYSLQDGREESQETSTAIQFLSFTPVSATPSDYWPVLLCRLFFEAIRNRGNSSLFVTEIKLRTEKCLMANSSNCFTISCSAVLKNSYCPHWTRLIPTVHCLSVRFMHTMLLPYSHTAKMNNIHGFYFCAFQLF